MPGSTRSRERVIHRRPGDALDPEVFVLDAVGLRDLAMSQENLEVVRGAFDAFSRGDSAAMLATLDPTVRLEDHDRSLDSPATYEGHGGFLEGIALVNEGFEDVRYTPEEVTEIGARVLVTVRRTGHGSASGVAVDERQFHVFDLENGRIVRVRAFLERKDALEAVGPRE